MYRHLIKKVQSPPVAGLLLKRHASWTQGEGPNYSKNLIVLGIATAAGVTFAFVSIEVSCLRLGLYEPEA